KIVYTYDPLFLRAVTRYSQEGVSLYTHSYCAYDSSGHLLKEHLIHDLGTVSHHYDVQGRKTASISRWFQEISAYDCRGNLAQRTQNGIPLAYGYDGLGQ